MIGEPRRFLRYLYGLQVVGTPEVLVFATDMDAVEVLRLIDTDRRYSALRARFKVVAAVEILRYSFEPPSSAVWLDRLDRAALRVCQDIAEVSWYVSDRETEAGG